MGFINLIIDYFSKRNDIYGSAAYLKGKSKRNIASKKYKGLCIDGKSLRIPIDVAFQHVTVEAASGMGKTSRLIQNNIYILGEDQVSLVITDPSGEILQNSGGFLQSKGFDVKVLNLGNPDMSHKFNPIGRINSYTDAQKLAEILIETACPGNKADNFWEDSAKSVLTLWIKGLLKYPKTKQNLRQLLTMLQQFGSDQKELDKIMSVNLEPAEWLEYKAFLSQDDKVIQGVLSTCRTALNKLSDPNIAKVTELETLHFETIRKQKTALFLIVPEHEQKYYSFVLSIFFSQLMTHLMQMPGKDDLSVFMLIDEAGNIRIPNLSGYITTLRKRRVSVSLVLQDYEQLVQQYGKSEASTIYNGGASSKIYFPGLSLQSSENISRMLGQQTLMYREKGFGNRNGINPDRERALGRSLLTVDEVKTLPDDHILYVYGNKRPLLLKVTPWYKIRSMRKKSKIKFKPNHK